jgi:SAM-dependent methyltransferase
MASQPPEWLKAAGEVLDKWANLPNRRCLDIRPPECYNRAHLIPSTNLELYSWNWLDDDYEHLMPPKSPEGSFLVVIDEHDQDEVNGLPLEKHLTSKGWFIDGVIQLPQETWTWLSWKEDPRDPVKPFWEYANKRGLLGEEAEGHELFVKPTPVLEDWIDYIERDVKQLWDWRVLEFGCGKGFNLGYLTWRGCRVPRSLPWIVQGVDEDSEKVRATNTSICAFWREGLERDLCLIDGIIGPYRIYPYTVGDDLQSEDALSSLVLVLNYFPNQNRPAFFQNLHDYMAKGAYLLFSYYTDPQPYVKKDESSDYEEDEWLEKQNVVKPGEVEEYLESAKYATWEIYQGAYSYREDGRRTWDVVAKLTTSTLHERREEESEERLLKYGWKYC